MSQNLFFATSNKGKIPSVARVLGEYGINVEQFDIDIPELQAETAIEIAREKAIWAFAQIKKPVMVVDSAFTIPILKGFPGPNVKWTTKQIGLDGYLRLMLPWTIQGDRACIFQDALAYMDTSLAQPQLFLRNISGHLAPQIRGEKKQDEKSALWRLFIPDGCNKTIGEMSDEELLQHRKGPHTESMYREFAEWILDQRDE